MASSREFSIDLANKLVSIVLARAQSQRESAGLNGDWSDGGASKLETQARFYSMGVQRMIPPEWESYSKEMDPEYDHYLRLKKKFEEK